MFISVSFLWRSLASSLPVRLKPYNLICSDGSGAVGPWPQPLNPEKPIHPSMLNKFAYPQSPNSCIPTFYPDHLTPTQASFKIKPSTHLSRHPKIPFLRPTLRCTRPVPLLSLSEGRAALKLQFGLSPPNRKNPVFEPRTGEPNQ